MTGEQAKLYDFHSGAKYVYSTQRDGIGPGPTPSDSFGYRTSRKSNVTPNVSCYNLDFGRHLQLRRILVTRRSSERLHAEKSRERLVGFFPW